MKMFDCVRLKREMQERIWNETKDMSREEEVMNINEAAQRFRQQIASDPNAGKGNFKSLFDTINKGRKKSA